MTPQNKLVQYATEHVNRHPRLQVDHDENVTNDFFNTIYKTGKHCLLQLEREGNRKFISPYVSPANRTIEVVGDRFEHVYHTSTRNLMSPQIRLIHDKELRNPYPKIVAYSSGDDPNKASHYSVTGQLICRILPFSFAQWVFQNFSAARVNNGQQTNALRANRIYEQSWWKDPKRRIPKEAGISGSWSLRCEQLYIPEYRDEYNPEITKKIVTAHNSYLLSLQQIVIARLDTGEFTEKELAKVVRNETHPPEFQAVKDKILEMLVSK